MANVPVTPGTGAGGANISTLPVTRDGVTEQVQLSWEGYDLAIVTSQTTVTNVVKQITSVAPSPARRMVRVTNMGPSDLIFVGPAAVTAATGHPIQIGVPQDFKLGASLALFAVAASAVTVNVAIMEFS